MAGQRTSFGKLERDRNKKAKAAAKRERRQDTGPEAGAAPPAPDILDTDKGGELSASDLLALIESIHQRLDAGTISFEDFEEKKVELLGRLPID